MEDNHPCCIALDKVAEQADDAIRSYESLPNSQRELLRPIRESLEKIKELCDAARGAAVA